MCAFCVSPSLYDMFILRRVLSCVKIFTFAKETFFPKWLLSEERRYENKNLLIIERKLKSKNNFLSRRISILWLEFSRVLVYYLYFTFSFFTIRSTIQFINALWDLPSLNPLFNASQWIQFSWKIYYFIQESRWICKINWISSWKPDISNLNISWWIFHSNHRLVQFACSLQIYILWQWSSDIILNVINGRHTS